MTSMMTLQQAHALIPASHLVGDGATALNRVHSDSRTLQPGDLFVALSGDRFDGAEFFAQAREKQAAAAICSEIASQRLHDAGLPGLLVSDTRAALATLATNWRRQFQLPVIAVTGSNGKTTVTQMVGSILRAWVGDRALVTQGNFNNDIGVPLTLLRLTAQHQAAVVELGMNHPGEIAELSRMTQPTIALVNNAQREHLEFMSTVEAVARENGSVFGSLKSDGVGVFPADEPFSPVWEGLLSNRVRVTFGGLPPAGDAQIHAQGSFVGNGWQLRVITPHGSFPLRLKVAGLHNVRNAMAATACAVAARIPLDAVQAGLEVFEPVKGRSRVFDVEIAGRKLTLVDDSYNANPDSVRAAIDLLSNLPGPRLLVLGDMGEVGDQGPQLHAEVGGHARNVVINHLYAAGALSVHACQAFPGARHFTDQAALIQAVLHDLPLCRSVLIKGSRFMGMERVVQAIEQFAAMSGEVGHAA